MGIIGVIAAISIPNLINTINKKLLTVKLKNHIASIQQLINDQMVMNKTRNLTETDFASPDKLFTSSNFAISQTCNTTASCWSEKYRRLQDLGSIDTPGQSGYMTNVKTIVLKDGTILSVMLASKPILPDGDYAFLEFWVDVNGKAGPNIGGRDYFIYFVTNKGRIMDELQSTGNIYNEAQWLQQCKSGERRSPCVTLLQNNGWKMTY